MMKRGMSDSNLHRFSKGDDGKDQKLSSFLPGFLVKKIEKEDANLKQSLFFDEGDNDDEALEIKMDAFIIKESLQNVRKIY
jgi:hypothetical protein